MWPLLAFLASGVLLGVFAHRAAIGALYTVSPAALEPRWLVLGIALSVISTLSLWLVASSVPRGRPSASKSPRNSALCCAGLLPLLATFGRPEQDVLWNTGLLIICGALVTSIWFGVAGAPLRSLRGFTDRVICYPWFVPALAAALALLVYLATIAPSVVVGDSSEMQVVAYTLGVAHPTGYPLYTLLGKLFTWLPFGNVAFRVNLMSAAFGALSAGVLAWLVLRLTRNWAAALSASLILAFSRTLWSQAVIAEVYALHLLIVLSVLALLVSFHPVSLRPWLLACLAFGLGLAHHRTVLLLAPALLVSWLAGGRRFCLSPRALIFSGLAALFPLALYVYLPLRWPTVHGRALTIEQFWWYVTGSGYSSALRWEAMFSAPDRYQMFLRLAVEQFTYAGLALALVGVVWAAIEFRGVLLVSGLLFLSTTSFGIAYYVPDVEVFFLPSHAVLALWIGLGIAGLAGAVDRLTPPPSGALGTGFGLVSLLLPLFLVASNWSAVDRSRDWEAHEWGQRVLQHQVEPGALIVADVDKLSPLRYFLGVEAPERDIVSIMPDTEEQCWEIIAESVRSGRPTYLARFLPDVGKQYALTSVGPLVRLRDKNEPFGNRVLPSGQATDWPAQPGLALVAYEIEDPLAETWRVSRGETISFTLHWQAGQQLIADAKIRTALIGESGRTWYATPWRSPVQGLYPTVFWRPREIVADYWEVAVPPDMPPGRYALTVEVASSGAAPQAKPFAKIQVTDEAPGASRGLALRPALATVEGSLAIAGIGFDSPVAAGSTSRVRVDWRVVESPADDYSLRWLLVDESGKEVAQGLSEVYHGEWATSRWKGGASYLTTVPAQLPGALAPGRYELCLAVVKPDGQPARILAGWPAREQSYLGLGRLEVIKGPGALTNFDNKAILLRYELGQESLRAGETLRVLLEWQCVSPMNRDYTVFLHLLDSEQRVRAQIDCYPVNGTRPTSQWRQGETLVDLYELLLPANLPSGSYVVEAGLYLAATMERLPVVDDNLRSIDDRVLLGAVSVVQ